MRIGVDLGGTKTEAIALDDQGTVLARERVATPAGDYDATVAAIVGLVAGIEDRLGATASVGVGLPGSLSPVSGRVRNANSTWLNGRPFDRDLAAALRRDVRIANDANCFALSEAVDGAGAGHRVVFGVILGTGVGGGLVVDGAVWNGRNGVAGEWGHDALPRPVDADLPARPCWCGRLGCNETYLSGPALLAEHRAGGHDVSSTRAIVERAARGSTEAAATLERYVDRLARALAAVVNVVDPDVVVLGGGLSNIGLLYDALPERIAANVFADACSTPIVKNRHGDSSGVRGAAWLWPVAR